jgi:hypothetical protein
MKSLTEHLWFEVPGRRGFVNLTDTVAKLVQRSDVQEGLCLVNARHITASVFINDAEKDFLLYRHRACEATKPLFSLLQNAMVVQFDVWKYTGQTTLVPPTITPTGFRFTPNT